LFLPLALLALSTPTAAAQKPAPEAFEALQPGEFVTHALDVPVRIVLIGFEEAAIDEATLASLLPPASKPLVRYPQFYGISGRDLGLEYRFAYQVVRKGPRFEDRFFAHLAAIGQPGQRTLYQTLYNAQAGKRADVEVPDEVLLIDAPSVERWLERNDASDRQHTLYFVNWYGHEGFRFHVYTRAGDPDPDTGFAFAGLASRKVVSWGGSSGRAWFYDFSAGPEFWGGSFNVDDPDLDGDGEADYRIPPIWEYALGGYRAPALLSLDMALVARFVAINLLFAPSPLYDPLVTAPGPLGRKIAHVTMLEDDADPAQKGARFFDPAFTREKLQSFQPYYRWRVKFASVDPLDAGAKKTLDIFTLNDVQDDCWVDIGTPFAQPYCYFAANRDSYVPRYGRRDYVAPVFAFNTTDAGLGAQLGLLGFADDNWASGTQTMVFTFGAPVYRSLGYGFTSTTVHEVGHHVGLSHPHDGYDSELGLDYGPAGFFYFAWLGDESDTVMHYFGLSNGFGRNDSDNMRRWEAAGYLNRANVLAGDLLASPKASRARAALRAADEHAAGARRALGRFDYLEAATDARWAYSLLAEAASELGVSSARLARAVTPLPEARGPKTGCRPRQAPQELPPAP
jgi:hypothetical protein